MTYLALYREWRPQTFAEVVGQEHVVRTLRNALAADNVAHAYLFCGPRGTGKTTIARLLAKAINCRDRRDGEPCNKCDSCGSIIEGSSLEVIEIDGASYGLVDDIRDLREKIQMAPAGGGRRVYIIDEVHMLGRGAFAALLKTIEEPPPHAVLILATTEPHKVPVTITSRCQRFDFHRLNPAQIEGQLHKVAAGGGFKVEDEVVRTIARKAEGSMRDALSLLDQCLAFSSGPLTMDDVRSVLGSVREDVLLSLADGIAGRDLPRCLEIVAHAVEQGEDLRQLLKDLIALYRDLLVLKVSPQATGLTLAADPATLAPRAEALAAEWIQAVLEALLSRDNEMRYSGQPRLVLEMALFEAAGSAGPTTAEGEALSGAQGAGVGTDAAPKGTTPQPGKAKSGAARKSAAQSAAKTASSAAAGHGPGPDPALLASVREKWGEFGEQLRKRSVSTHALLKEAEPAAVEGNLVTLAFVHSALRDLANRDEHKKAIEETLSAAIGRPVKVSCRSAAEVDGSGTSGSGRNPLVKAAEDLFGADVVEVEDDD